MDSVPPCTRGDFRGVRSRQFKSNSGAVLPRSATFLSKLILSRVDDRDTKHDDTSVSRGRWLRDWIALYAGNWQRACVGGLRIISGNQGSALAQLVTVSSVTSWLDACRADTCASGSLRLSAETD